MTNRIAQPAASIVSATVLALLLQACAATPAGPRPGSQGALPAPPVVRQPVTKPPRDPQLVTAPGLEGVIGATADQLVRLFGEARLDLWEGDARKLQFTGSACVLDIYLYPTAASREPVASHVDARRGSDAAAVDRAACVKALRR